MPTPFRVTGAFAGQGGAFIAQYSGALFVVALSSLATTSSAHSTIGIFKSTDQGETWSQVGSEITLPSSDDSTDSNIPVGDSEWIHGCLDVAFPTNPYGYIVHADPDHKLMVSRVNFEDEDFDVSGAAGPDIQDPAEEGNHDFLGWMIEQASDGSFGVLANLNSAGFDTDRVYAMSLSGDLNSWSSKAQVSGQTSGIDYTASGIARGTDGRVHGWIEAQDESDFTMCHAVVVGGGGGIGSALQDVVSFTDTGSPTTGAKIFQSPYVGAFNTDGEIAFLFANPGEGVGANFTLSAAHATSDDDPAWTIRVVDAADSPLNSYWAGFDGGVTFRAAYNVNNATDTLRVAQYASGAWGAPSENTVSGIEPYFVSARSTTLGVAVSFGRFLEGEDQLWFALLPNPSGVPDAYSQWVNSGRYGPWEWSGALFSMVFGNVAADQDNDYDFVPVLKLIKSTDGGETWTDVASETIDFSDDVLPEDFAYAPETFGTCQDVDFETNGYVYVAYPASDQHLYVKRLSLDDEAFIDTSVQGPDLPSYSDVDAGVSATDPPHILIEQNTAGNFALMYQHAAGVALDELQVYVVDLASDLSAWGTATKVNGQSSGKAYSPYALLRGADQRIHGLLWERDGTALAINHTLVLTTSGTLAATSWDAVWAETHASGHAPGILNGAPVASLSYDAAGTQTLVVLYTDNQGVGIGGPYYRLRAAIAASANSPSWSHSTVHDDGAEYFFYTATLCEDASGDPLAVFQPVVPNTIAFPAPTETLTATWNGSTWDAGEGLGFTAERLAATRHGLWFIRQAQTSFDTEYSYPLFFTQAHTGGGGGGGGEEQILTGSTIPSAELIYNTSGVTGGGLDTCGTPIAVEPSNACNPIDPDTPIPDAPASCVPQGYSY